MTSRLLLIAFLWLGSRLAYAPDYQELYARSLDFLLIHQADVVAYSVFGAVVLVLCSFILAQIRIFGPLHMLARLFFEASQLTIYALSFVAVVLRFEIGRNLWLDPGLLAGVPFLALLASCLSLWIFDFNYPLRNRIQRNLALPVLSLLIVFLAGFLGYTS